MLAAFSKVSAEKGGTYGDTLTDSDKLTQLKMVKGCMAAGISLNAIANPVFKEFLSHVKVTLPGSQHLGNHVPFILREEVRKSSLCA